MELRFMADRKYLGLPTVARKNKKLLFCTLKDRIWKKITGLEGWLLSKAMKEVLIKVVCQAKSTYSMSIFKLPIGGLRVLRERFIGKTGKHYVNISRKKGWVSGS
ncbi:unnamed protein product [Prunus armeniaca]|uniref:Uncharacterized protein n=1 Tax=Prunus armeniaca TaxID=36596 RepID=A0A6J5Y825_PRUAR|nr:unnamed protein product [Prunus armeniaca]CAB4320567.1 unnamed protein product [Prunus armeniaca]